MLHAGLDLSRKKIDVCLLTATRVSARPPTGVARQGGPPLDCSYRWIPSVSSPCGTGDGMST